MDDTAATPASPATATATASAAAVAADGALKKAAVTTAASSSKTSVKLLIKSSNQQYDDLIIESDMLWTVRRLKMHLSLVYPSKPPVGEQKLIYSGQLLTDTVQLKDVIRSYKDVYTQNHIIHLVYIPKNLTPNLPKKTTPKPATTPANPMEGTRVTDGLRQRQVASTNVGTSSSTPGQANINTSTGGPQHLSQSQQMPQNLQHPVANQQQQQQQPTFVHYVDNFANPNQAFMGTPPFVQQMQYMQNPQINSMYAAHQVAMYNAWMRQVYMQYMEQMLRHSPPDQANNLRQNFLNTMNASTMPPTHPYMIPPNFIAPFPELATNQFAAGVVPAPSSPPALFRNEPVVASSPPIAQPAQEAQPQIQPIEEEAVVGMEARRFPNVAQDDQNNRDWLDSFLSITHLAIFLTILYFNTSPIRCLIVLFIGGAIYLYHIGVLRIRHERNNNNINRNNNAQPGVEQAAIRQGVQEVQVAAQMQEQHAQDQGLNDPPNDAVDGVAASSSAANGDNDKNKENAASSDNGTTTTAAEAAGENENNAVNSIRTVIAQPNNEHEGRVEENLEDEENPSVISIVRTFVITFFTSLLPETPAL